MGKCEWQNVKTHCQTIYTILPSTEARLGGSRGDLALGWETGDLWAVFLNLLSIFSIKSNLKQSVSSTIQTSPILSSLCPIVVWLLIFPFSTHIFMDIALWRSITLFLVQLGVFEQPETLPNLTLSKLRYIINEL